ncbi:hypothetical protein [Herbiconiux liangxiaofengii]|uniref:hypothetical protein n=1 Tax=Herbiconiux liangxiaofengii TaxID=3342795 RepID=UPI0035B8D8A8
MAVAAKLTDDYSGDPCVHLDGVIVGLRASGADPRLLIDALVIRGQYFAEQNSRRCLVDLEEALDVVRQIDDGWLLACVLEQYSQVFWSMGLFTSATDFATQASAAFESAGDVYRSGLNGYFAARLKGVRGPYSGERREYEAILEKVRDHPMFVRFVLASMPPRDSPGERDAAE